MNETTSHRTADDGAIRRLVTELVDEAPPASEWSQIEQRVDQPNSTMATTDKRLRRSRPGLMLVAAAAILALVGLATVVATRGTGPAERLVPADSEVPNTVPEVATPTTAAPIVEPVQTTGAPPDIVETDPSVVPGPDDPATSTPFVEALPEPLAPVDYPERALADVTRLPHDAWVVAGTLPDGIVARYATVEAGPTIVYGDQLGRSLSIGTHRQPIGGGETLDVAGITWSTSVAAADDASYIREIGVVTVDVTVVGIDRESVIAILGDLRTGGDQLLPVEVIQPLTLDLVADEAVEDDSGFGVGPTAFRAAGVNGWYCIDVNVPSASVGGCGYGRNGALASETIVVGEMPDEEGVERTGFAGIVSPEVSFVEVAFADGTTYEVMTGDLSGLHDDRFWVTRIELDSSDPFIDSVAAFEVRLYGEDGSLLGTVPFPES